MASSTDQKEAKNNSKEKEMKTKLYKKKVTRKEKNLEKTSKKK